MATSSPGPTTQRAGTATVAIASVVAAAAGYGVLLVSSRTLTPASNADFLSYWALLFAVFGVLAGLQNESTRAVGAGKAPGLGASATSGAPVLGVGLLVGAAVAAVVGVSSPWWAPDLIGQEWSIVVPALCIGVVAFGGHCALAGALGGLRRWPSFSLLVASEASVRLLLVGVVALLAAGIVGLEVASALAAGTWLVLVLVSPGARSGLRARADVPTAHFVRNVSKSMAAAAATAVLVVGFPVAVRLTSTPEEFALAAPLLLAVSLTRAPLLIPLNAYQGVAISHFLSNKESPARPLVRLSGALLVVGVVGAGLAALVGPWLMRLLFGPEYGMSSTVLACLTLSAAGLAILTMTGAATLATGRHGMYAAGWIVATVTALAGLLLPLPLEWRVVAGLACGPVLGVAVHVLALARRADERHHVATETGR